MRRRPGARVTGSLLIAGGAAGFAAAVLLTLERIRMFSDPGYVPVCDLGAAFSCGRVLLSWQAEVFGFPNTYLGLAGFPLVAAVGVLALGQVRIPRSVAWVHLAGVIAATGFAVWLVYQSTVVLEALCPYCMVVWAAMPLVITGAVRLAALKPPVVERCDRDGPLVP
ncbi:vitamin K epoxide reductase family protein [Hoyosella sp. YIM 151337]|uniref:vitamin K epoxide reductase family protein n=1 Tax=Hoyosella sp. YIM 151337 TaxID=2992742 RepID=UPI002235F7DA|nr:vitamin K epoxide reductase family protein [Hoyosella sp. YIM 151337]MCW4352181.1 vitamin K epoxide reductase family protein [Hoyosella sp. YIM 151337]